MRLTTGVLAPGFCLRQHATSHGAPFPILADQEGGAYRTYAIERSLAGTLKGMVTRMPTLVKAMSKGYLPTSPKGSMTTMPADFLIDEDGTIEVAYYGSDDGDHLPFDQIRAFSHRELQRVGHEEPSRSGRDPAV